MGILTKKETRAAEVNYLEGVKPGIVKTRKNYNVSPEDMCVIIDRMRGVKISLSVMKAFFKQLDSGKEGLFKVQTAAELLSGQDIQDKLKQLSGLVSVVKRDYDILYLQPLNRFAEYVQLLSDGENDLYNCAGGLIQHALDRAITALKLRQARMLPPNSDAETCYKEQDVWTLAIFLSALLYDCWQVPLNYEVVLFQNDRQLDIWDSVTGQPMPKGFSYCCHKMERSGSNDNIKNFNLFLMRSILPAECLAFLYKYKNVFDAWINFINDINLDKNHIAKIISQAEDALLGVQSEQAESEKDSSKLHDKVTKELIETFVQWLKQSFLKKCLTVNQENSMAHMVKHGLFLKTPNILNYFLHDNYEFKSLFAEGNLADTFIEQIGDDKYFIKNDDGRFVHEYYKGEWDNINYISGLLLKPDIVFSEDIIPPPVTKLLKPKPVL